MKEIFSVKREGTPKYRSAPSGDQLRKDVDYHATFSGTVSADCIRMFFSLACQLGKGCKVGSYERSVLIKDTESSWIRVSTQLYRYYQSILGRTHVAIRKTLLRLVAREGTSALRNLNRKMRGESSKVPKLLGSVF